MWSIDDLIQIPMRGILGVMILIILGILFPQFVSSLDTFRGSGSFNCVGYVDPTGGTNSYNASMSTALQIACPFTTLGGFLLGFGMIIMVILFIIYPNRDTADQPQYI